MVMAVESRETERMVIGGEGGHNMSFWKERGTESGKWLLSIPCPVVLVGRVSMSSGIQALTTSIGCARAGVVICGGNGQRF